QALGAKLLDEDDGILPAGGAALQRLARIDLNGLDSRLSGVQFEIAVDVDNPLCGDRGAATIFGPQKGASPEDVAILDRGLARLAEVCRQVSGRDETQTPGTGAAG